MVKRSTEFFNAFYAAFKATFIENSNASSGGSGQVIEKWWLRKVVLEASREEYIKSPLLVET
ncbi:hypothetical protein FGSG_03503 [Fusarium graminearum PH-1]|uniref:hypothetical protein n=1 Tax=Gibberella zeae (strain ATCC MYA-4620 / CBS 123657 / FGSC 9075 / NRRL 31084 / PH-1) TaxID=229533 RepID=UPI000023D733|nr:hypothetical protein FGSG_03503 [Fusarium graminearum PH-1]ESU09708.1 hypothetical protein FGSG_03503 [Fusarium graminearum PH-1]|eukprot:XP_011322207.1 hypothetical protein FGSG_03503 [Fusarium graminearum PH-1]